MSSRQNMKTKRQTPTVRGQQVSKKSFLSSIALASTLFCLSPISALAVQVLDAAADGQNTSNLAYPPTTGYVFTAPNVDFTILNGVTIGKTGNTAIDNGGHVNDHILFNGNAIVDGDVGTIFAIGSLDILSTGIVEFNGSVLNQTPINFYRDGVAQFNGNNISITGPIDNLTPPYFPAGELVLLGNTILSGNIGVTHPLAAIVAGGNIGPTVTLGGNAITINAQTIQAGFVGVPFLTTFIVQDGTTVNGNFTTATQDTHGILLKNNTINGNIGTPDLQFNNITIGAGKTANVNGNIYATNTIIDNAGILRVGDNKSIFGFVISTGGAATLEFLGNSSISYDIGIANKLSEINMIGPAGTTVNLTRDLGISATTVKVNNGGTLALAPNIFVGADGAWIISDGSIAFLGEGSVLNPNDFTLGPNSTLALDMGGSPFLTAGIIADNQALLDPSATIEIVNPGFSPYHTTSSTAILSTTVAIAPPPATTAFTTNSLLTSVSASLTNAGKNLVLNLTSLPSQQFANQGNTHGVAGAIDAIASVPGVYPDGPSSGALRDILYQMGIFTDAQSLNNSLATLSPIVDGAITYESFNTQNAIFGTVGDRMDRMNFWRIHALSEAPQGVAAGDSVTLDQGAWVKVYHQHGKQKIRDDIAGYSDHSWGITIGGDTMITNHSLIGASFSWTALDVNHDVSGSKTNANSYQATMYSSVDFDCPLYVNAAVGVSYNNYITARNIVFNNLNIHPRGHYHGIQTGAKAEIGYVFGGLRYHAIPIASLYYSNLALRSYQETDAGNASQIIRRQDYDTLLVGAGGKLVDDYPMSDNYLLQSEAHAMMFYDLFDDNVQTTSQFVGAGPSFNTFGFKPARDSYNLGASLTLFSHYSFNMSAEYDFNFKQDYRANSAFVRVRYEFL